MSTQAQLKNRGIMLIVSFFIVLAIIFLPIFPKNSQIGNEKINGLNYMDNFFNALSKGSANYIEEQRQRAEAFKNQPVNALLKMRSAQDAELVGQLFATRGITTAVNDSELTISANDFGRMISFILDDAEAIYENNGHILQTKYGIKELRVLYFWYLALNALEKDLTQNSKFSEARFVKGILSKAIEPAYNFYGIKSKSVRDEIALLICALAFYVIYTMWYGFGLLYLFEGMGIKLEH
jgi:hypothetical protein